MVPMNTASAYMRSKGQVVIPARLRRKYGMKEGTRLNFAEEEGHFVIQPVTKKFIDSFCGILSKARREIRRAETLGRSGQGTGPGKSGNRN